MTRYAATKALPVPTAEGVADFFYSADVYFASEYLRLFSA